MPKKSKKEQEDDFVVEVITATRVVADSSDIGHPGWEYFVQWYGYPESEWTWEPHENLLGCDRLMKSFWSEIGSDEEDYPPGYVVHASKEWIESEKKFFRDELEKEKKRKTAKANAQKSKVKHPSTQGGSSSRAPSASLIAPGKSSKPSKPKVVESSENDSDADSDIVLLHKNPVRKGKAKIIDSDSDDRVDATSPARAKRKKSAVKSFAGEPAAKRRKTDSTSSGKPRPARKALANSLHEAHTDEESDSDRPLASGSALPQTARAAERSSSQARGSRSSRPNSLFDGNGDSDSSEDSAPLATAKAPVHAAASKPARPQLQKLNTSMLVDSSSKQTQTPQSAVPSSAKQMQLASSSPSTAQTPSGSSLSTKNRLGMAAMQLSKPGDNKKVRQLPNFKKKADATPTLPHQPPPPRRPSGITRATPEDNDIIMQDDLPTGNDDIHVDAYKPSPVLVSSAEQETPNEPDPNKKRATDWLDLNMSNPGEAPPPTNANSGRTMSVKSAIGTLRMKKKWKWEGELSRMTDQGTQSLGRITIKDISETRSGAPSMDKLIKEDLTRLKMGYLRSAADLNLLLPATKGVQQFAGMTFEDQHDRAVQVTTQYMLVKNMFCLVPIFTPESKEPYAFLAIYHPGSNRVSTRLHLSASSIQHKSDSTLSVALLPWDFAPAQIDNKVTKLDSGLFVNTAKEWRTAPHRIQIPKLKPDILFPPKQGSRIVKEQPLRQAILCRPDFTRAIHALRMPAVLLQSFMRARDVFIFNGDPASNSVETELLSSIFGRYKRVKIEKELTSPRLIFIHRSALQTLSRLANFSSLRANKPNLQIYLYGTDLSIHPGQWAVKEVYPIGGVVTFTPEAFLRNPLQCFELAGQIHKHQLWACYIIPCVLGAVVSLVSGDRDLNEVISQRDFILNRLVVYLQEGVIGLTSSPPNKFSPGFVEKFARWEHIQRAPATMTIPALLKNSLANVEAMYARLTAEQRRKKIIVDVCNELATMQRQPIIMNSYRRFVVIVPEEDRPLAPIDHSLEYTPVHEFKFNDVRIPKDDVTMLPPIDEMARMSMESE